MPAGGVWKIFRRKWFIVTSAFAALSGLLVVMLAVAAHFWQLSSVPDIKEPFDLEQFGHVGVAPAENAFDLYRVACASLVPGDKALEQQSRDATNGEWRDTSDELRNWLEQNRDALNSYRPASERPKAVYIQPAEHMFTTQLPLVNRLVTLTRLAHLEGLRLEATRDPLAAWNWYFAALCCSRHVGQHGCTTERLIGIAMHAWTSSAIMKWTSNPTLTATDLRRALVEVRAIHARTVPLSRPLMSDYLMTRKYFANIELFSSDLDFPPYIVNHCVLYPMGEPEMGRRLTKLIWTNWLSQCDRPRHLRMPIMEGQAGLFLHDPSGTALNDGLPNSEIEKCLKRSIHGYYFLRAPQEIIIWHDCEIARQRILEVALAVQICYHELGRYPDTVEELFDYGLEEVPIDPFGSGESIRFRREPIVSEGVSIWSIGPDGIDDAARLRFPSTERRVSDRGDLVIRSVLPPRDLKRAE